MAVDNEYAIGARCSVCFGGRYFDGVVVDLKHANAYVKLDESGSTYRVAIDSLLPPGTKPPSTDDSILAKVLAELQELRHSVANLNAKVRTLESQVNGDGVAIHGIPNPQL